MAGIDHELLGKAMRKSKITPQRLADETGKSLQYICDITKGRRTLKRNPALIDRIAEVCDVPPHWIEKRDRAAS